MKRILLVSNMYPDEHNPFYGVFVKNSNEILLKDGHQVDRIILLKENGKLKKTIKYLTYYLKIVMAILFGKYDLIYVHYASHNALPILIGKLLKKNTIIYTNVHGSDVVPETKIQSFLQPLVQKLLDYSTRIIVPSEYFGNYIMAQFKQPSNKLHIFPSGGINRQVFFSENNKKNSETKEFILGYVGRIDKDKGWDDLLKAFESLNSESKIKLIIVGNGKQYVAMKQLIDNHIKKDDIVLYNMLGQEQLRSIYNQIDLFVFPTKRKGESLGLVGIEAMACGTPVLGSRIAGLQSYIKNGINGMFYNPGDVNDLQKKIMEFIELDMSQKEMMKLEALKTAEIFESDNVKEQLLYVFR